MNSDEQWMKEALQCAEKGRGRVEPNPLVGAVIVEKDKIIASGYYEADGGPHAEINALNDLGEAPSEEAVMYVTLEPCSTHGRTGACTDALIKSGIKTVVIGATDPYPTHQGKGIAVLQEAGIEVRTGILEQECTQLNEAYNQRW